jgi:hypothetical protein
MVQAVLRMDALPDSPLDAAAEFHETYLAQARAALHGADALVLVFPVAPHPHRAWRLAAVQELAREAAPARVNGVEAGGDEAAAAVLSWLEGAPGVTGQLLAAAPGR